MWGQKTGSWSLSSVVSSPSTSEGHDTSREASEHATLSQQAKEHLHNQSAWVTFITGSAKGEQGNEDPYKASELIPLCLPNKVLATVSCTRVLDWTGSQM